MIEGGSGGLGMHLKRTSGKFDGLFDGVGKFGRGVG